MTNRQEFNKSHCERVWNIAPDCPTFFPNRPFLREARETGRTYAIAMQNSLCLPALRHMTRFAGAKSRYYLSRFFLIPRHLSCPLGTAASQSRMNLHAKESMIHFLTECISGSWDFVAFLVELGAWMIVASTIVPPCMMSPAASSRSFTSSNILRVISCFSNK